LRASSAPGSSFGVANAGIGGNRVLSDAAYGSGQNALARFETDVLNQPGVTHVIVMEGINDIGNARSTPIPTAEDLIAAHKQLIARAHARGIKIFGATRDRRRVLSGLRPLIPSLRPRQLLEPIQHDVQPRP
jgi:lysophospholipase L1-like esterase